MGEKDSKCKCTTVTARTWLIVFNTIFVVLGLAVAAAGGVIKFGKDLVSDYFKDMLEQVKTDGNSIADILDTIAIVMMVVGILLMGFGIIGCCGGCCMIRCCLLVYSLVMIKLLVAELTIIIVWFVMKSQIESRVKSALQSSIDGFYAGDTGTDAVSLGFNFLFITLDCCGIDNYTELYTASNWNRTYSAGGSTYTLVHPFMCCKLSGSFPNVAIPSDVSCATTPNSTTSNYGTGCYDAFMDYISAFRIILIIIGASLAACEICSAVSAIILNKQARERENRVDSVPTTPVKKARLKQQSLSKSNMNF